MGGEMKRYFKHAILASLITFTCSNSYAHKLLLDKGISKDKQITGCLTKTIRKLKTKNSPTHLIELALEKENKTLTLHVSKVSKKIQIDKDAQGIRITLPHIYSRWCISKDQNYLVRKTNKIIKKKLENELGKQLRKFFKQNNINNVYNQLVCAFQDTISKANRPFKEMKLANYKLNEKTGEVYNLNKQRVKDKDILKKLIPYFQDMRIQGQTTHIVKDGKLKERVEKERLCEEKRNQCVCVIEETTLAPKYSLASRDPLINISFHHFVVLNYRSSSPFIGSPEECGMIDTSGQTSPPEQLSTESPEQEKSKEATKAKTLNKNSDKHKAQKGKALTLEEKAEKERLFNIPTLNASDITASSMPGMNLPPVGTGQNQAQSESSVPQVNSTLPEGLGEAASIGDDLLDDLDMDHEEALSENQQDEVRSLMDSGGNIYTSTRVFSPNGFVRLLKENEFVCYKPQYSQDNQVSIFKFTLEDLEASSYKDTEDEVFPFFNYLCLKKPELEAE